VEARSFGSNDQHVNILEKAKKIYDACGYPDMFADLSAYMAHGCLYITPDSLLILKPVKKDSDVHPGDQWNVENPDGWYVQAIIGEVKDLIGYIPDTLPWVGWERGVKKRSLKWFNMKSLKRRT